MSERFSLTVGDTEAIVEVGDVEIARYVFRPTGAVSEGPKPYLHPVRALDGAVLTAFRPWDHRWHKGLQMTWTHVSGENFWGGPTYTAGEGYVLRDNVGSMRHERFTRVDDAAGDEVGFTEELTWITQAGDEWLSEVRMHRFHALDKDRGFWALDFSTALTNVTDRTLELGSPTTQGRPAAGYTGFFLRMPRSWTGGTVLAEGDIEGADALMGTEAAWAAFSGQHDEVDGGGTVLAYAGSSSAAPPIKWFARSEPFPVLSPSASFDQHIPLAPGEQVRIAHRHVFGDRIWSPEETRAIAAELAI